jgi:hypothetical protein
MLCDALLAPRSLRSVMRGLRWEALSALRAPNAMPSISGAQCTGLPGASVEARIALVVPFSEGGASRAASQSRLHMSAFPGRDAA